ncbi:MAG: Methyltransferase type 11 [bacterium]|nr:Methyltransferase type 11 [bacterium]
MGHHGRHGNPDDLAAYVAKMEDPSRDQWQKPAAVVGALAVAPGETVCDVGAGPGYFALRLARAGARVFAVDVEPKLVELLRDRVRDAAVDGVTPVLGLPDDPLVPPASCDLVLIVDTFHHFPDGVAYLRRLARLLRAGGRLVNIDFHARELPVGPSLKHKVAREEFLRIAEAAGFTLAREETFLPYQYFLQMQPPSAS